MPPRSPAKPQRLDEAVAHLTRGLAGMQRLYADVHRTHDCLPLPQLLAPNIVADMDRYAAVLLANVYDPASDYHHRSPAWITARQTCSHQRDDITVAVWEAVEAWRRLVGAASRHAQRQRLLFTLADTYEHLQARLTDYRATVNQGTSP